MANNMDDMQQYDVSMYEEQTDTQTESVMREVERKKKRKELDRQIELLCNRAVKFEDEYGPTNYRTQILVTFLDVTLQMKTAIDLLNDVGVALQCIGQAITCVDDVLNMQQEILEGTLTQKYGFWERLKRKRRLNRAIRNNAARMRQMCDMLIGSLNMVQGMTKSLCKVSVRMKTMSERSLAKQGKNVKSGKGDGSAELNSEAKKYMAQYRESNNISAQPVKEGTSTDSGTSGGGDGGSSGSSSSVGDISDIA